MKINLKINIQHHKGRRERWTYQLYQMLEDWRVEVCEDESGDLWHSAKTALSTYDKDTTHILLLQDDILPCRDFIKTVERIVEELPEETITFFSNKQHVREAQRLGLNYIKVKKFLMSQAFVIPVERAVDFIAWSDRHINPKIYFDDDRLAMYHFYQGKEVWATAPSLVEHLGWNGTTLSDYDEGHVFDPKQRMATWFIGFENSGLDIDWTDKRFAPDPENLTSADFCEHYID